MPPVPYDTIEEPPLLVPSIAHHNPLPRLPILPPLLLEEVPELERQLILEEGGGGRMEKEKGGGRRGEKEGEGEEGGCY